MSVGGWEEYPIVGEAQNEKPLGARTINFVVLLDPSQ